MSLKATYTGLITARSGRLDTARQASALTLPHIVPPEGYNGTEALPQPNQSLGTRGVNNLAAKLLLALIPINQSFFRIRISEQAMETLGQKKAETEQALATIERRVAAGFESRRIRPVLFEALKHAIIAGSCILFVPKGTGARIFRLDQYVIRRDSVQRPVELVIREEIHPRELADETKTACQVKESDQRLEMYTGVTWDHTANRVKWFQEINGIEVPDSQGSVPLEKSPYIPLRWTATTEDPYGRGHVEEYLGDLTDYNDLCKAFNDFSGVAAKIVFLFEANGVTDADEVSKAESGDCVVGRREDVTVLQLEKFADFRVVRERIQDLRLDLSHAFLLTTGTVRDAERVTREEIRMLAQELEDTLGGTYTVIATEFLPDLVSRQLSLMEDAGEVPRLPRKAINLTIVTGFDALGRSHDMAKFRAFLEDARAMFGEGAVQEYVKVDDGMQQLATGHGIDAKTLIRSENEVNSNRERNRASDAIASAVPRVAPQLAQQLTQQQ